MQYSANYGATGQTTDGFESGALDSTYTTGGNAPWFVTTGTVHGGTYAAAWHDHAQPVHVADALAKEAPAR